MTTVKSTTPAHSAAPLSPLADTSAFITFLQQADVCREQAREAAGLKRFRSALGLFATASALCRHVAAQGGDVERNLASERLSSLALEMATYNDLAHGARRSMR